MLIYQRLKNFISEKGLKQTHIANKCITIDNKTLSAILNGNRKLAADEFEDICINGLEIKPEYFFNKKFQDYENLPRTGQSEQLPKPAA